MIALSSGEAEYCGPVSATSQMLGLQSILLDWDGNSQPMCGPMSQWELRLEADDGLDE